MNKNRIKTTFNHLSTYSETKKGISRIAYTDVEQNALTYLIKKFKQANLTVKKDAIGNVIARREGMNNNLPIVSCGSHIDSVYAGGKYDGTIGVIAALEIMNDLNEKGIQTKHPIEVIIFACEESARFGVSMIGSKAMAGLLEDNAGETLFDSDHISLREAINDCGLNWKEMKTAERAKSEYKVFLELHIEQGPVLEVEQKDIGIVTGIAAPTRYIVEIEGVAAHSGSTPMYYRKDAFLGAAEIAICLEQVARRESESGTVATIGICDINQGAMNVIPGNVNLNIDIRSISELSKQKVIDELFVKIKQIKRDRGLFIQTKELCNESPVKMDEQVIASLKRTCKAHHFSYLLLPSGGGHDAMNMTTLCPTGLIFIPSKAGLSHNPEEHSELESIHKGAFLLKEELLKWAIVLSE